MSPFCNTPKLRREALVLTITAAVAFGIFWGILSSVVLMVFHLWLL